MDDFTGGIAVLFAVLLVSAGTLKFLRLTDFELALVQLLGTRPFARLHLTSRVAAALVAAFELALGALVGTAAARFASSVALLATTAMFVLVSGRALSLHVSCGCFPGRRAAEVSSLVRSVILAGLACVPVARGGFAALDPGRMLPACRWAALLAVMTYLMMRATGAAARRRYPSAHVPRRVPRFLAEQILAGRDQPSSLLPGAPGEWVEAVPLCRAARIPVSALFAELEQIAASERRVSSLAADGAEDLLRGRVPRARFR